MVPLLEDDSAFAPLLAEERLMALGPGSPNLAMRAALERLDRSTAFAPHAVTDDAMADACLAGIWLYHDYLEQSHGISQSIATPTGSYWHGILHRREPDRWNSKYWFERVGCHPIFPAVCGAARTLVLGEEDRPETRFLREQQNWNPFAFIDLCEQCRLGIVPMESLCRKIQLREWQLLFAHSYRHAIASR